MVKGYVMESSSASFRMLFVLLSLISSSTAQVSAVLTLLSLTDGSSLCAVDAPSLIVPLDLDYTVTSSIDAQQQSCVADVLKCAWICKQDKDCTSYNYNQALLRCELYYYRPLNYALNPTCAHYRNKDFNGVCLTDKAVVSAVSPSPLSRKMIPAECCSLPFTLNGQLYHSCAQNASNPTDIGCLIGNRTWVSCLLPTNYSVKYSIINLTVPTFNGSIPVVSINNWIVILNRFNCSVNFLRNWTEYRNGFGDPLTGEYWIGLEKIRQLTSSAPYRLRIELQTLAESLWFSTEYYSFLIDNATKKYALHVSGYCGDAGDGLAYTKVSTSNQNGMKFSTFDSINDNYIGIGGCAAYFDGGSFWFNNCGYCCLTSPCGAPHYYWHPLTDIPVSSSALLKASRMMIKP